MSQAVGTAGVLSTVNAPPHGTHPKEPEADNIW